MYAIFFVQSHFSAPLFSFLIGTPNEPVVLIEYQAKCNYGWNSCFVGANNLPWHGTQWNGNEGLGRGGCVGSARAGARRRQSSMRYQNFDNPIDYQCNNWWPSRRKGVGFSVVLGFGGKGGAEGLSGMGGYSYVGVVSRVDMGSGWKGVDTRNDRRGRESGRGGEGGRESRYHCKLTINELALIKEPLRS